MLRNLKSLLDYTLAVTDGEIGHVTDFLFDESSWTVRYLVVDTRKWLIRHRVLLSTAAVESIDDENEQLHMAVTKEQVEESPEEEDEMLISREAELKIARYWQWTPYWVATPLPEDLGKDIADETPPEERAKVEAVTESVLRSADEATGYRAFAQNGEIGKVADFAVDEEWRIRYVLVHTENWTPDRTIFLDREDIEDISWAKKQFTVAKKIEDIRKAPTADFGEALERLHTAEAGTVLGVSAYEA